MWHCPAPLLNLYLLFEKLLVRVMHPTLEEALGPVPQCAGKARRQSDNDCGSIQGRECGHQIWVEGRMGVAYRGERSRDLKGRMGRRHSACGRSF